MSDKSGEFSRKSRDAADVPTDMDATFVNLPAGDPPTDEADDPSMQMTMIPDAEHVDVVGNNPFFQLKVDADIDYGATVTGMPISQNDDADDEADSDSPVMDVRGPDDSSSRDQVNPDATVCGAPAESEGDDLDDSGIVDTTIIVGVAPADPFEKTTVGQPDATEDPGNTGGNPEDIDRTQGGKHPGAALPIPPSGLSTMGASQAPVSAAGKKSATGSRSGSGSGKLSGLGSKASQIWSSSANHSLYELIRIKPRPVSGGTLFQHTDDADFEIIEKLAEGGMGVVYVARQRSLNRELAIKTLKGSADTLSGTSGRSGNTKNISRAERQKREMFLSEALVTANLVHPNIIPIHELAETTDGVPYYVMKRVHGIPWNKTVTEMSLQENLDVLHKVCDAVAYAHHHGVINRDLKPENIMLGEFGEVLVLDWGLAVPAPHAAEQNFRSPVASFGAGTPAYMSPELWTGPPEAIGEWSDIYLLGAILFEIITGEPPHDFPRPEKTGKKTDIWSAIDNVLRENVIRSTSQSGELLDIAYKAMRKNPDERYGSVLEFQFAVRNFQRHEESRRLSTRAAELVVQMPADGGDYQTCQTAAALFEEALRNWPQNVPACTGLRETRLRYARLASRKGDYDLGLQIASLEEDPDFLTIRRQLQSAGRLRSAVKWTAVTLAVLVVALGGMSIYNNGVITNLKAAVGEEEQKARLATTRAKEEQQRADVARVAAERAKAESLKSEQDAMVAKQEAVRSQELADAAKALAALSQERVTMANAALLTAEEKTRIAVREAEAAEVLKREAEIARREAEKLKAAAVAAACIARVETQAESIRGLTLNENYADALREINRLLEGDLLPQLPEEQKQQRTAELQAQREQLLRRAKKTDEPLQTLEISPGRSRLASGDFSGNVLVYANPGVALEWPSAPDFQLRLPQAIARLKFVSESRLLIASGDRLWLWDLNQPEAVRLEGHAAVIQGLDAAQSLAVTGDKSGQIIVWDLERNQAIGELRVNTSVLDVALIPGTRDFLYVGARGSQSGDVLAYRAPEERGQPFVRLGQLQMSREHNYPPLKLAVSPDGGYLAVSNHQNGVLFLLRRMDRGKTDAAQGEAGPALSAQTATNSGARTRRFPFEQPAEREKLGDSSWRPERHRRPINDIRWSDNSNVLLTASDDRCIGVWAGFARSPDNPDGTADMRDSSQGAEPGFRRLLRGHGARVTQAACLDESGQRISSASVDGYARLWNLRTIDDDGQEIRRVFRLTPIPQTMHRTAGTWMVTSVPAASNPAQAQQQLSIQNSELSQDKVGEEPESKDESFSPEVVSIGESAPGIITLHQANSRHRGGIQAVRFSPDGELLLSGASDGSVVLWNMNTGMPVHGAAAHSTMRMSELFHEGHEFNIARMKVIGPDHSVLVTSGYDGTLRLWNMNAATGREGVQQQVISGLGLVNSFAASPDGDLLVTSTAEGASSAEDGSSHNPGQCLLWHVEQLLHEAFPRPYAKLTGAHTAEVTAISVSVDGHRIATGGRDGKVAVWDARTGDQLASLRAHGKGTIVTALEWRRDQTLLSAGLDGRIFHWSLCPATEWSAGETAPAATSEVALPFRLERLAIVRSERTPVERMALSPDEQQLLVISVETNRATRRSHSHLHLWTLNSTDSSTDSDMRASSGSSRAIPLAHVSRRVPELVSSVSWSSDGSRVLVSADGHTQIFRSNDWRVERVVAAGPNTADSQLIRRRTNPRSSGGHTDDVRSQRTSTHGSETVSECLLTFDGTTASLWDLHSGDNLVNFRGPYPISTVDLMSVDDTRVALAAGDSLRIFNANDDSDTYGRPLCHLQKPHRGSLLSVSVSPQSPAVFLTSGADGRVIQWQWQSPLLRAVQLREVAALSHPVTVVRSSPDGAGFLMVTPGGQVHLGRVDTDRIVTLTPSTDQPAEILTAEFSADGRFCALGGTLSQTAESAGWVLAITPEQEISVLCRFSGHAAGGITTVSFASGTPYLVSGGTDGALIVWNWQNPLPGRIPAAYEAYRFLSGEHVTAHSGPITSIAVSTPGTVASASEDGLIRLWNLPLLRSQI